MKKKMLPLVAIASLLFAGCSLTSNPTGDGVTNNQQNVVQEKQSGSDQQPPADGGNGPDGNTAPPEGGAPQN